MSRVNQNLYYSLYRDLESQLFKMQQDLGKYGVSYSDMRALICRLGYPNMDDFFDKLANKRYCEITLYQFAVWKRVVRNHLKDIKFGLVSVDLFNSPALKLHHVKRLQEM